MEQLSALDTVFLHVENATTTGHVGSLILLQPGDRSTGQLDLEVLYDLLEQRLHLVPRLRQRLVEVPLRLARPYWLDDPQFDLEYHVREVRLADPGTRDQLGNEVARLHALPLHRSRPLWELYLVHGLEGGRQALYSKVHHSVIDGVSGAEILATLMDDRPEGRPVEAPSEMWGPRPLPGAGDLLVDGLLSAVREPAEALRTLPAMLPHLADFPGASLVPGLTRLSELADTALRRLAAETPLPEPPPLPERRQLSAPPTRLNASITAHRRIGFGSVSLSEVKAVKNAFGMTVNDVVMALCASALRRWLLDHDSLPDEPLVVAVPVSVRGTGEAAFVGNSISLMLVELPTSIRDPRARLAAVQAAVSAAKASFDAVPATILQDVAAVVPTALAGLAARAVFELASRGSVPFNLFVSNVPGPQQPLYVGGLEVAGLYPLSAVTDVTGALNITVFSYNGALDFGLVACREVVPDVAHLVGYLSDALAELLSLVAAEAAVAGTAATAPRRSAAKRPKRAPAAPRASARRAVR